MRPLAGALVRCPLCGRARWTDDGVSAGLVIAIVALTLVTLIVLGMIGIAGRRFR